MDSAPQLERTGSEIEISQIRSLDSDYLARLDQEGAQLSISVIKEVKTVHHSLAKLLASGMRVVDAARKTGQSPQTIYRLRRSPAFQNLELHYTQEHADATDDLLDRMEVVAFQLLDVIQDKLDKDEEIKDTTIKEFTDMLTKFTDRVGRGPVKRTESKAVTIHLTEEQLQRAKDRANVRSFSQDGGGPSVGGNGSEGTVVVEITSTRIESEGEEV